MAPLVINVDAEGRLLFVETPELADLKALGPARTRRASHVEPTNAVLRWVFHTLRTRVADTSRLAAWTRRWPCTWRANLAPSHGPVLAPFIDRAEAIAAEVAWLNANL